MDYTTFIQKYLCVFLPHTKSLKVIPACWLQNAKQVYENMCINGINQNIENVIFFSNDENKSPDFSRPIVSYSPDLADACFKAFTIKLFDSRELAIEYARKRRAIRPAVYNERKITEYEPKTARMSVEMATVCAENINTIRKLKDLEKQVYDLNMLAGPEDLTREQSEPSDVSDLEDLTSDENEPLDLVSGRMNFEENVR